MPDPRPPLDALDRWLAAERVGSDGDAEAALSQLLAGLPPPELPAGFAGRAVERALAGRRRRLAWGALGWRARRPAVRILGAPGWAAALAGVAAFAALLALPAIFALAPARLPGAVAAAPAAPLINGLVHAASFASLLPAAVTTVIAAGQWLAGAVEIANKLLLLVRAVTEPLATPPVAALAGACLLVSALAMRFLYDLIQRDRRWVYADPI